MSKARPRFCLTDYFSSTAMKAADVEERVEHTPTSENMENLNVDTQQSSAKMMKTPSKLADIFVRKRPNTVPCGDAVRRDEKPTTSHADDTPKRRRHALSLCNDERQQMIDAGQKSIGPVHCSACDFYYTPQLRSDVDAHTKHHREHASHEHRVRALCTLRAGSAVWRALANKYTPVQDLFIGQIYRITFDTSHNDPVQLHVQRLVKDVVCAEIGFTRGLERCTTRQQAYLYVCKAVADCPLIVSCIVVEPIRMAQLVPPVATAADSVAERPKSSQSSANVRAELGVNKMWTHHEYRRKGYAAKLIDAARSHLCLGASIARSRVAFSHPTEAGDAFARSYNGNNELLVYAFD